MHCALILGCTMQISDFSTALGVTVTYRLLGATFYSKDVFLWMLSNRTVSEHFKQHAHNAYCIDILFKVLESPPAFSAGVCH